MNDRIAEAREAIAGAKSVAVLTGAGISAESGVPTFRGEDGLWKNYRAEELATPQAFAHNHKLVWEWYNWRRELIRPLNPNPAHYALAEFEEKSGKDLWLLTQNVDGLHRKAGSKHVVEIHGCIWVVKCTVCTYNAEDRSELSNEPPCPTCGELLRPGVVWFGESLPVDAVNEVYQALDTCDVLAVIGTSSVVYPAASFAGEMLNRGKPVIEINLDPTPLSSRATISLQGKAGNVTPQVFQT